MDKDLLCFLVQPVLCVVCLAQAVNPVPRPHIYMKACVSLSKLLTSSSGSSMLGLSLSVDAKAFMARFFPNSYVLPYE